VSVLFQGEIEHYLLISYPLSQPKNYYIGMKTKIDFEFVK